MIKAPSVVPFQWINLIKCPLIRTLCALVPHRIQQVLNSGSVRLPFSFCILFENISNQYCHHSLACWVAGVSCPILAFKKDFCPSVIFRHEYISCHEFLGEAYLHILSILHRRGVFPFTNYPGIVASVLYYTAEKQMVMWGESDRGGEDWHQWSQAAFESGTLQRSWSPRHCGDQGSYTE